jgi:hypothetical protein
MIEAEPRVALEKADTIAVLVQPTNTMATKMEVVMTTKKCTECARELPLGDFHLAKRGAHGRAAKCRDCKHSYYRANRRIIRAKARAHYAANRERIAEYNARYRAEKPVVRWAHNVLNYCVRTERIERPKQCPVCGRYAKLDAHHHDYNKPLDVEWLCKSCHKSTKQEEHANG